MIVGKGGVGKTTLVKRIFNQEMGIAEKFWSIISGRGFRKETDGIDMHEWVPHKGEYLGIIRLWDFAGQDIFYTTHQFFLSQNSISFLLFNLTEDLNYESKLEFWINSIQYRAPKSKLFIIGTHLDKLTKNKNLTTTVEEEIKMKSDTIRNIISKIFE